MESVDSVLTRMGIVEDPVRSVVTLAIKIELLLISSLLSGLFCSVMCSDPKLDSHRFNDILNEAIAAARLQIHKASRLIWLLLNKSDVRRVEPVVFEKGRYCKSIWEMESARLKDLGSKVKCLKKMRHYFADVKDTIFANDKPY